MHLVSLRHAFEEKYTLKINSYRECVYIFIVAGEFTYKIKYF